MPLGGDMVSRETVKASGLARTLTSRTPDADSREASKFPQCAEFSGDLSSSGLPAVRGRGGVFPLFTGTAANLLG